jgi:hypothetical protein
MLFIDLLLDMQLFLHHTIFRKGYFELNDKVPLYFFWNKTNILRFVEDLNLIQFFHAVLDKLTNNHR